MPIASVYRGGECFPATAASLAGDQLTVRFDRANVTATYRVTAGPHYLAFRLLSLTGDPRARSPGGYAAVRYAVAFREREGGRGGDCRQPALPPAGGHQR